MKLLVYCYEYPPIGGGAGNALAHLSRIWSTQGHAVTIVTSQFGDLPKDEVLNGVRVIRLTVGRRIVSRGRIREMLRYMFESWKTAETVYREVRPDLAVAFMALPSGVAPMRLKKIHNLPFVTELRGGDVPGFLPSILSVFHFLTRPWILSIWEASARVIANSEGLAELARKAAPRIDVRSIPNGVDTQVFCPASGSPRPAGGGLCRCVFVGRLVDGQKQIKKLIEVVGRQPGLELVIVGSGPDEAPLRAAASRNPGRDRIFFKGWMKNEDLLRIFRSSDVYVSASMWEGMSNSALEALSCGLPLVLSDISGHRELVTEGENGFLFDPVSTADLEERILRLALDPDRRAGFGRQSRIRAVRDFDWSISADRHLKLYREALSS